MVLFFYSCRYSKIEVVCSRSSINDDDSRSSSSSSSSRNSNRHVETNDGTIIIIIIIMSCRQHGYPWPSLATSPNLSSPPAGLLDNIPRPHIAAECKFGLVVLLLLGYMLGSIGVRHLRARPCFSSSVRRVWLV